MADIQNLNDLLDVEVPSPEDGDVLYWDATASLWKCKAVPVGGGTVERVVRSSTDDAYAYWNASAWVFSLDNERWHVGYWNVNQLKVGGAGRFLDIYIPKDATIIHAYLKPTARSSDTATEIKTRIHGEKNANPITFSNIANYQARTLTDAVIDWDDIASWTLGELYQSPDIKTIIQEIVNLDAWASGNPLVIFWDDHDDRTAHIDSKERRARSWDHANHTPPMLYIEWTA